LGRLINGDRVICKEERDNETAVYILRDLGVKFGDITKNSFVIVNVLEEISLWFLRKELIDVPKGIYFVSKTVVRRNLSHGCLTWLRIFDLSKVEMTTKLSLVELLSELINTLNMEVSSVSMNITAWLYLIVG